MNKQKYIFLGADGWCTSVDGPIPNDSNCVTEGILTVTVSPTPVEDLFVVKHYMLKGTLKRRYGGRR